MNNPMFPTNGRQGMNPMQMIQQIKSNPAQFLQQAGITVPENMMNDPTAIIQHLLQSGRVNQAQINAAYQAAQKMGIKL